VTRPHPERMAHSHLRRSESQHVLWARGLALYGCITLKGGDLATQTKRRQGSRSVAAADLLIPPPPRPLVVRERLFELLNDGTEGLLTLISAPAGSGKTSLLSSWLGAEPRPVAWLTPRPRLTDAAFWAEWLTAVQRVAPPRSALRRLAAPRNGTPPAFVVDLLNSFADLEEPLLVVIDDFHHVRSAEIAGAMEQLLRAAPSSLRLILSTRHDPLLPLHLLRASGELTELRLRDLALTHDEARELLDGLGVEVEPAVFSLLLEQTEGWAAGLRLFTLAHRSRAREMTVLEALELDERPAFEYLMAEVLARQTDERRDFLLATAVAERFTADLADAMTGRADGARIAERLVAENVFIERLESQPPCYRYHHLFAELLRAELRHTDRARLSELHARAARWHFENRAPMDAVHHALAAGDTELLTVCLVDGWFELVARTDAAFRTELLELVPKEAVDASAELSAVVASVDFINGQTRAGTRQLAVAAKLAPRASDPSVRAVLVFAHLLQSANKGQFTETVALARELLEISEDGALSAQDELRALALAHLGVAEMALEQSAEAEAHLTEALETARRADVPYATLTALGALAWLELMRGRLRRAARLARTAVELAQTRGWEHSSQAALAVSALGLVEYEWDDLEAADAHARELGETARQIDAAGDRAWSAVIQASLSLAGRGDDVEFTLERLRGIDAGAVDSPRLHRVLAALEARLLAAAGEHERAVECIDEAIAEHPASPGLRGVRARVLLASGNARGALDALDEPCDSAYPIVAIERDVVRAIALRATGDEERALAAIGNALASAEPEGVRRPFLSAGHGVREILAEHLRRNVSHRWFTAELLRGLDGADDTRVLPAELLDPLSTREGEVLRFLPTMMSNADIASELFVSVNTVKTHVKSIYRKLDVTRRQDAVRRARQLHLI
jgi:LuxR family transcriptional regulator, maltose regulon positive regulatory protein